MMSGDSDSEIPLNSRPTKAISKTAPPGAIPSQDPDPLGPSPNIRSTVNPDSANHRHHESGYGTDFSPLSFGSPTQFSFGPDADDNVFELSQEFSDLLIEDPVYPFENETNGYEDTGVGDDKSNDQEVESLLAGSDDRYVSKTVSDPIDIKSSRPRRPIPFSIECGQDSYQNSYQNSNPESASDYANLAHMLAENERATRSSQTSATSSPNQYSFRLPSSQRSVATQTPPSMQSGADHCLSLDCLHGSDQMLHSERGDPLGDLFSVTDDNAQASSSAPLPDVVPFQRNRSASLPVVQPLQRHMDEETVGRTLRRISDEFEFYHRERRRQQRSSSLPQTSELWNTIRRYFSSDPEGFQRSNAWHSHKDFHEFDGD